jgi:hypothetical protein
MRQFSEENAGKLVITAHPGMTTDEFDQYMKDNGKTIFAFDGASEFGAVA